MLVKMEEEGDVEGTGEPGGPEGQGRGWTFRVAPIRIPRR
jgi:hypothetical protein